MSRRKSRMWLDPKVLALCAASVMLMAFSECPLVRKEPRPPEPQDVPFTSSETEVPASSSGELIVFTQTQGSDVASVNAVAPDAPEGRDTTLAGGFGDDISKALMPELAPDGRTVAFTCQSSASSICTMNLAGGDRRVLIQQDGGQPVDSPTWRFDQQRLGFVRANSAVGSNVIAFDLAAKKILGNITTGRATVRDPHYASTSSAIVFAVKDPALGKDHELFMIDAASQISQLTSNDFDERWPRFSPDDGKLAFVRATGASTSSEEIFVMDLATRGVTRLTQDDVSDITPAWSPDGQQIVFARMTEHPFPGGLDENYDLYRMGFDGANVTPVTGSPNYNEVDPDWAEVEPYLSLVGPNVNEDQGPTAFRVRLSGPLATAVSVNYRIIDGDNLLNDGFLGEDFEASAMQGTITFAPGDTVKDVPVQIIDDETDEDDQFIRMFLSEAQGALLYRTSESITIRDNDPTAEINVADVTITEGEKAVLELELSRPSQRLASTYFETESGSAAEGTDYQKATGKVEFYSQTAAAKIQFETSRTIEVQTLLDSEPEGDETFKVRFVDQFYVALPKPEVTVTIKEPGATPPIPAGRIVFVRDANGFKQLFTMKADGSEVKHISPDQSSSHLDDPSWSSDGSKIIYTALNESTPPGQTEILERPSGGEPGFSLLITHPSEDVDPVYKPGSTTEFWWASDEHGDFDLFRGPGRNHITTATADEVDLTFGTDATEIAYASNAECGPGPPAPPDGDFDICLQKLDASGSLEGSPENLTQEGSGVAASKDVNPDFSPDGSKIVFERIRDGNSDIYVVDVASKAVTRLTTDPALESEPTFSPDGKQIAFVREVSGDQEIFLMDAQPEATAENISKNPGPDRNPEWGPASTAPALRAPASTAPASTAPASTAPSPSESSLGIAIPVLMMSMGAVFARRRKRL